MLAAHRVNAIRRHFQPARMLIGFSGWQSGVARGYDWRRELFEAVYTAVFVRKK